MSHSSQNILLVGAGKMGGAMLGAWVKEPGLSVTVLDPGLTPAIQSALRHGAKHIQDIGALNVKVDVVILAIKPQLFETVAASLADALPKDCLIISILAGTSIGSLENHFPDNSIIRAMPNTPAAIGKGITAITGNDRVNSDELSTAKSLLGACGDVRTVENEILIDAVTAISGSGPAYVFYLVEALTTAAQELGLREADAAAFSRQMVIGAGALLDASEDDASQLRKNVTSPNGTTQAALEVLMDKNGLSPLIKETTKAAFKRAQDLAKE